MRAAAVDTGLKSKDFLNLNELPSAHKDTGSVLKNQLSFLKGLADLGNEPGKSIMEGFQL